ncbi:hypothetical protein D3C86_2180060 [compost metagenome]
MHEEGLAYVIEQHEQNDQPAQGIDALQALADEGGRSQGGCHENSLVRFRVTLSYNDWFSC